MLYLLSSRVLYQGTRPLLPPSRLRSPLSASCPVASCEEYAPASSVDAAEVPESAWLMTALPPLVALLENPG